MKNPFLPITVLLSLFMLLLGACNLNVAAPPQAAEHTETEAATPEAAVAEETLAPVELTGPPMEVGSTYLYVDGAMLVAVPAGEFIMGNGRDDSPVKTVTLDEFWIYQTEVTNAQYALCVAVGKCSPPDLKENLAYSDPYGDNDPVVGVDWHQAAAYCDFVHARLPTEAEWEKTARGPDGNIYPWGEAAPTCDYLNIGRCVGHATAVTTYPQGASYYGALDMSGNILEWAADWYYAKYYDDMPLVNPTGPVSGDKRSVRSSSFRSDAFMAEAARRFSARPDQHADEGGFRCVVESEHLMDFAPYCEWVTVYGDVGVPPLGGADHPTIAEEEACPPLSIVQAQYCGAGDTPLSNVTFNGPPGSTIDAGGCAFAGGSTYVCDAPAHVEICADCQMVLVQEANCPPGYHLEGDVCLPTLVWVGACLPGFSFDPETQCCAEAVEPHAFPGASPCPVGTFYADPPGACVSFPAAGRACNPLDVSLPSCGGDHHGSCDLTDAACAARGLTFNSQSCCCLSANGGCIP